MTKSHHTHVQLNLDKNASIGHIVMTSLAYPIIMLIMIYILYRVGPTYHDDNFARDYGPTQINDLLKTCLIYQMHCGTLVFWVHVMQMAEKNVKYRMPVCRNLWKSLQQKNQNKFA